MSLADARAYIKTIIAAANSALLEHQFPFTIENVASVKFDNAYHIAYGDITSELSGCYIYRDQFPITLSFFKKGHGEVIAAVDSLLATVENIRQKLSAPESSLTQASIKKVFSNGIEISSPEKNQDFVIIKLRLLITHLADNNRGT